MLTVVTVLVGCAGTVPSDSGGADGTMFAEGSTGSAGDSSCGFSSVLAAVGGT